MMRLGRHRWRRAGKGRALLMAVTLAALALTGGTNALADRLLIPMDFSQTDHLKAYGLTYWVLERGVSVHWLLNYRAGSFLTVASEVIAREARLRGVMYEWIGEAEWGGILDEIERSNMETVLLEKAPRIAIYTPPNAQPWDDAVTLALDYAEVRHEKLWDEEVLAGELGRIDWLHLHHEDFTGQHGKFYGTYRNARWYQEQQTLYGSVAQGLGFADVSTEKKAVAARIREYVLSGGFLFAMCSATDTFDIAMASQGVDIVETPFDGDPVDPAWPAKLTYGACFAFTGFALYTDPTVYEFSDIDTTPLAGARLRGPEADYFTLFDFSAKYDPVPAMLTQCHVPVIGGFMGQTTAFRKALIKKAVTILGESEATAEVKYLHGNAGKGTFTFLGGHDPEDYTHRVGDPPTHLALHKSSPGYRLILNNILFPAAQKKNRKT